jgi:hypothetical protein
MELVSPAAVVGVEVDGEAVVSARAAGVGTAPPLAVDVVDIAATAVASKAVVLGKVVPDAGDEDSAVVLVADEFKTGFWAAAPVLEADAPGEVFGDVGVVDVELSEVVVLVVEEAAGEVVDALRADGAVEGAVVGVDVSVRSEATGLLVVVVTRAVPGSGTFDTVDTVELTAVAWALASAAFHINRNDSSRAHPSRSSATVNLRRETHCIRALSQDTVSVTPPNREPKSAALP